MKNTTKRIYDLEDFELVMMYQKLKKAFLQDTKSTSIRSRFRVYEVEMVYRGLL